MEQRPCYFARWMEFDKIQFELPSPMEYISLFPALSLAFSKVFFSWTRCTGIYAKEGWDKKKCRHLIGCTRET